MPPPHVAITGMAAPAPTAGSTLGVRVGGLRSKNRVVVTLSGVEYFNELVEVVYATLVPTSLGVLADLAISLTDIQADVERAKVFIGLDIVYDQALFEQLRAEGMEDFKEADFSVNDKVLLSGESLDCILDRLIEPHRRKAGSSDTLRAAFKGVPGSEMAIDVLTHGARDFMVDEFTPNGGRQYNLGKSYLDKREICNDNMRSLCKSGRCICFTLDACIESGCMTQLHTSPAAWAAKAKSKKGRVCMNYSKRTKDYMSVNEGIDFERSDSIYPMPKLPLLPDIAEIACQQRDANPGAPLSGATVDVKDGYHQFPQTVASAKRLATLVKVPSPWLPGAFILLVVIYLVGIFGHSRAGNIFCMGSSVVNALLNLGRVVMCSATYIDDTIIICPSDEIDECLAKCLAIVQQVWGEGSVQHDKVATWKSGLVAIGWEFDFLTWKVQPRDRGLAKLLVVLFDTVPIEAKLVREHDMDRLKGLLQWYASGIPAGKSFLASLYACPFVSGKSGMMRLTAAAQRDLMWWRALVAVAHRHPFVLGADIDSVRRFKVARFFARTDASSLVGAGGLISLTKGGDPLDLPGEAIRWTKEEIASFDAIGVSINVLEYFAQIYFIMLWADHLLVRGPVVVHIECDNTAAVAWIMKSRGVSGNAAIDALTKTFTLFCLQHHLTVFSTHIKGIDNIVADFRSRDVSLWPQDMEESSSFRGTGFENCTRQVALRRLLHVSVTTPESLSGKSLLSALTALRIDPGRHMQV